VKTIFWQHRGDHLVLPATRRRRQPLAGDPAPGRRTGQGLGWGSGDLIAHSRAVEVLERIGSAAARDLLRSWSGGDAYAPYPGSTGRAGAAHQKKAVAGSLWTWPDDHEGEAQRCGIVRTSWRASSSAPRSAMPSACRARASRGDG